MPLFLKDKTQVEGDAQTGQGGLLTYKDGAGAWPTPAARHEAPDARSASPQTPQGR